MRQELVTEAKYLEAGMDLSGENYLTNITKIMNSSNRNRITWVAADGTVLFDNMADAFDKNVIAATVNYGFDVVASIQKENIFATQFHPEKSQKSGLELLKNYFSYA